MTEARNTAARMGTRAGEQFAATGLPSHCPIPSAPAFRDARAAWRRAYLRAITAARSTRRGTR